MKYCIILSQAPREIQNSTLNFRPNLLIRLHAKMKYKWKYILAKQLQNIAYSLCWAVAMVIKRRPLIVEVVNVDGRQAGNSASTIWCYSVSLAYYDLDFRFVVEI